MSSLICLIRGCTEEQKYGCVCEKHKNANICTDCKKPFVKALLTGRCGKCYKNHITPLSEVEVKTITETKSESKEAKVDSRKLNTCIECKKSFVRKLTNGRCGWCNNREMKRKEKFSDKKEEKKASKEEKEKTRDKKEAKEDSKEKKISKEEIAQKEDCPICLENYASIDTLSCENKHRLHKQCIIKSGKTKCPLCRGKVLGLTRVEAKELKSWNKKYEKQDEKEERRQLREEERYRRAFVRELFPQISNEEFEELIEEDSRIVMYVMDIVNE